jgi:Caspase domain
MVRIALVVITIFVATASSQTDAQAPYLTFKLVPRFALVVGAENYKNYPHVLNAQSDALEAATTLTNLGFAVSFLGDPEDQDSIMDKVNELAIKTGATNSPVIVVFYFAGHGFQNGAFPSIVPVGATDLKSDSVAVSTIIDKLATHEAGVSLFFLDSCRTGLADASQEMIRFSGVDLHNSAVLDLATENGEPAASSMPNTYHSFYTYSLTKNLTTTQSLSAALEAVRSYVKVYSQPKQSSVTVNDANISRFYLVSKKERDDAEHSIWVDTVKINRAECVELYMQRYPGSPYLGSALFWKANSPPPTALPEGDRQCPQEQD